MEAFQDANGVGLLDLRFWLEGLYVGKISEPNEQGTIGLQLKPRNGAELESGGLCSNFSKDQDGFVHKSDLYATHDLS